MNRFARSLHVQKRNIVLKSFYCSIFKLLAFNNITIILSKLKRFSRTNFISNNFPIICCVRTILLNNLHENTVMGIKGRRVHMIEELSQTIISFQRGKKKIKQWMIRQWLVRSILCSCIARTLLIKWSPFALKESLILFHIPGALSFTRKIVLTFMSEVLHFRNIFNKKLQSPVFIILNLHDEAIYDLTSYWAIFELILIS